MLFRSDPMIPLLIWYGIEPVVAAETSIKNAINKHYDSAGMVEDIMKDFDDKGEPIDPGRHRLEHEVKAITYHGLLVEERAQPLHDLELCVPEVVRHLV